MTLVQIAFIFMNAVAAFSFLATTVRGHSADYKEIWCSSQSPPSLNGDIGLVNQPGHFAWYELLTTAVAAASTFYVRAVDSGEQVRSDPALIFTGPRVS